MSILYSVGVQESFVVRRLLRSSSLLRLRKIKYTANDLKKIFLPDCCAPSHQQGKHFYQNVRCRKHQRKKSQGKKTNG